MTHTMAKICLFFFSSYRFRSLLFFLRSKNARGSPLSFFGCRPVASSLFFFRTLPALNKYKLNFLSFCGGMILCAFFFSEVKIFRYVITYYNSFIDGVLFPTVFSGSSKFLSCTLPSLLRLNVKLGNNDRQTAHENLRRTVLWYNGLKFRV